MRAAADLPEWFDGVDADVAIKRARKDHIAGLNDLGDSASVAQVAASLPPVVTAIQRYFWLVVAKPNCQTGQISHPNHSETANWRQVVQIQLMNAGPILQIPHLEEGLITHQHHKITHRLDRVHTPLDGQEIFLGMQPQILRIDVQPRQALNPKSVVPHSLEEPWTGEAGDLFFVEGIYQGLLDEERGLYSVAGTFSMREY